MKYEMDVRPEVAAFAMAMETRLRAHDADRGEHSWINANLVHLTVELNQHTTELALTLNQFLSNVFSMPINEVVAEIGKDAADVGNYAMMIADRADATVQPQLGLSAAMEDAASWAREEFPDFPSYRLLGRLGAEADDLLGAQGGVDGSRGKMMEEAADVLIILATWAEREDINLSTAVWNKMALNRTRTWDHHTMRLVKTESEGSDGAS